MSVVNQAIRDLIVVDSLNECAATLGDVDDAEKTEKEFPRIIRALHIAIQRCESLEMINPFLVRRLAFLDEGAFCHLLNKAAKAMREKKLSRVDVFGLLDKDERPKVWIRESDWDDLTHETFHAFKATIRGYL